MSKTSRQPAAVCQCGKVLDAAAGDGDPREGDISICLYCGRICIYGPGMKLREATCEETRNVMLSESGDFVRRAQRMIRMKS